MNGAATAMGLLLLILTMATPATAVQITAEPSALPDNMGRRDPTMELQLTVSVDCTEALLSRIDPSLPPFDIEYILRFEMTTLFATGESNVVHIPLDQCASQSEATAKVPVWFQVSNRAEAFTEPEVRITAVPGPNEPLQGEADLLFQTTIAVDGEVGFIGANAERNESGATLVVISIFNWSNARQTVALEAKTPLGNSCPIDLPDDLVIGPNNDFASRELTMRLPVTSESIQEEKTCFLSGVSTPQGTETTPRPLAPTSFTIPSNQVPPTGSNIDEKTPSLPVPWLGILLLAPAALRRNR